MQLGMIAEDLADGDDDLKKSVKRMIRELVEVNNLDVKGVQALVKDRFKLDQLSQIDINFIYKKYVKYCLNLWLADTLKLCEGIDSENFQEYLNALDDFASLTQGVPTVFAFSKYLRLVQNVSAYIPKKKESEYVVNFKSEFKHFLLQLNQEIRNELLFIHAFVSFLRSFKDVRHLATALRLNEFCDETISFQQLVDEMEKSELLHGELGQSSLSKLNLIKQNTTFSQLKKLKNFVAQYIAPPDIKPILTDGKYFLQAKSMVLELEKVMTTIKQHFSSNSNIYEIRLVVGDTLYLDVDLCKDDFKGTNLVIWCKRLVVYNEKVKIDVSGKDCARLHPSSPGEGKDGADGFAGESGGNVVIMAEEVENGHNLVLVSNGGTGGKGQDGGDGRDGNDGVGMTEKQLKADFFSPLRFFGVGCDGVVKYINKIKDYAEEVLTDNDGMNSSYFLQRKAKSGIDITYNHDNWVYGSMSAVFLCKGTFGEQGSDGGKNGLGGEGGYGGDIDVCDESVAVYSNKGEDGKPGESGYNGKPGKTGWDIGYSDFCNWREPVWSGLNENCKLRIKEHSSSASDRTWCAHLKNYISIENTDKTIKNVTTNKERQKTSERQTRQKEACAVNKKMVSKSDIQATYSSFMENSQKALDSIQCRADFEAVSKNMEILQEEKEEQQEEQQLNIQVQREAKLEEEKKTSKIVMERNYDRTIKEKLLDDAGKVKMGLLKDLLKIRLEKSDVDQLLIFVSGPEFQKLSSDENLMVSHIAISNYRQVVLNELSDFIDRNTKPPNSETFINIERFLEPSDSKSAVSDERLNSIDDYIVHDSDIHRGRIIDYCKEVLDENKKSKLIQPALQLFLDRGTIENCSVYLKSNFVAHMQKYFIFKIEKESEIQMKNQEFTTRLEEFPKLQKLWQDCEAGTAQRCQFDEKIVKSLTKSTKWNSLKQLHDAYKAMLNAIDSEFDWESCTRDLDFMTLFYLEIQLYGIKFKSYVQLLGDIFNVRLNIYEAPRNGKVIWKDSFSVSESRSLHILRSESGPNEMLAVNEKFMEMENERFLKGKCYNHVLSEMGDLHTQKDIDSLAAKYREKDLETWKNDFTLQCTCETYDIEFITHCVQSSSPSINVKATLESIRSRYVPNNIVLHLLAKRFSYEVCQLSDQELVFLANSVLRAHLRETQELPSIHWIISTAPQRDWIAEIVFLHLQNYYKTKIAANKTMQGYLKDVKNIELLLLFDLQMQNTPEDTKVPFKTVYEIFKLLVKVKIIPHDLFECDIGSWHYLLKGAYWHGRLHKFFSQDEEDDLSISVYYTQMLENLHGEKMDSFMNAITSNGVYLSGSDILRYLNNFVSEDWNLTKEVIETLNSSKSRDDVELWEQMVSSVKKEEPNVDRNFETLKDIIMANSKSSKGAKELLTKISQQFQCKEMLEFTKAVTECKTSKDIKQVLPDKIGLDEISTLKLLAAIDHTIFMLRGFYLRDTQKLSILMLLCNEKNNLLRVSTGEGKTFIVVAVAIIKALRNELVDVVTSSSVLAKRDALINKDIYDTFGVSVSHNCDDKIQNRIKEYSGNKVIYGDISSFQRDYLLDRFYGKNILGDRNFQNILVDEVDSMLLDKGNNMLYLSHDLPWLDKLTPVYIYIWQWINQPTTTNEALTYVFDENILKERVLHNLYGLVTRKDLKDLDSSLRQSEVDELFTVLIKAKVINENGTVKTMKNTEIKAGILGEKFEYLLERIIFMLAEISNRKKTLAIPNCLKDFVVKHLDSWITSAHNAFLMKEKENYIVDVCRGSDVNLELSPNIIILDKDTGTDQANSQWDEALHQFLQLKHGCKLSSQSLKAVYISNVSFFKEYKNLYGLTGTLGSQRERDLLQEIHEVEFSTMPTSKPKKLKEHLPLVCSNNVSWVNEVKNEVLKTIKTCQCKRSVLLICETVEQVEMFSKQFSSESIQVTAYKRDYEDFEFGSDNALGVGHLLISTN